MKIQNEYNFQSKPSLRTLQLIKERDGLLGYIERSSKPHPHDKRKPIDLYEDTATDLMINFDSGDIIKDLKMFRSQYLSNGGQDLNVLAEISRMEKEVQQNMHSSKKDTVIKVPEEAESIHQKVENLRLKHEEEMMRFDFKREKLIAQHELYELELSIREAESNKIHPSTKTKIAPVVLNDLSPIIYDSQYGFYIKWDHIFGVMPISDTKLTISFSLFRGDKPFQKLYHHKFDMIEKKPEMINMEKSYFFSNVPFDKTMRCILDIRLETRRKDTSIGWTSFDLFTSKTTIDTGSWSLKLLPPPIDFNLATAYLTKIKSYNESTYVIAFHLCDFRQKKELKTCRDEFTFKSSKIKQDERYNLKNTNTRVPEKIEVLQEKKSVEESHQQEDGFGLDKIKESNIEDTSEPNGETLQFQIGFQIYSITNFPNIDNCFVRCIINDKRIGSKFLLFNTENTAPGEIEGSHGWQFCSYHQIKDLAGKKDRTGIFEIFEQKLVTPPIPAEAWNSNELYKFNSENHTEINISINGLRFLPANVTATRFSCKIYKPSSQSWVKDFDIYGQSQLDEPAYSPMFSSNQTKVNIVDINDNSSVLIIKIYTIDILSKDLQFVGYATLNLFRNTETNEPITDKTDEHSMINFGYFQIPIHSAYLTKAELKAITKEDGFVIPRLPCATVLLSVLPLSEFEFNAKYESAKYYTQPKDLPKIFETHLYHFVSKERKSFSVRDRILSLGDIPRTALQTEESLIIWASKRLELQKSIPILCDLSYICKYNPYYGFKISIDQAYNLESKKFSVVVTSFSTSVYDLKLSNLKQNLKDDYKYSTELDLESENRNPKWKDGYHWYRKREANINLIAVIQIFSVLDEEDEVLYSEGWSLLPVFKSLEYVTHGRFHLPLFEGSPTAEAFQYYMNGLAEIEDAVQEEAVNFTDRKGSIVVRICDGRRGAELTKDSAVQQEFLSSFKSKFKPAMFSSSIISLKNKKISTEEFERIQYSKFVEETKLPYVP